MARQCLPAKRAPPPPPGRRRSWSPRDRHVSRPPSTNCAAPCKSHHAPQYEGRFNFQAGKAVEVTERKLPAIVLGGTSSGGDGAIHDPLLHPSLYEGVVLRRMFAFFVDMILMG